MTLRIPNAAEVIALKALLNHTAGQNQVLRLYTNDKTPAESDVAGDYTEATFSGYATKALTGSSWNFTEGNPSVADYAQQTFTSNAGSQNQNVYGYYITQSVSGALIWAERFTDGPYNVNNNGDEVRVTPRMTGQDTLD
jgi:hypothetical protein